LEPSEADSQPEILAQLPPPPFGGGPDCPEFMPFPGFDESNDFPPGPPDAHFLSGGPMHMRAFHSLPPMPPLPPDVELTDDQVEKLSKLKRETGKKTAAIMAEISSLEHNRCVALDQETLDPGEIYKQSAQINAQKQLLDGILTDTRIQMAQILTAEQRHKIRLFAERRELGPLGHKKPPATPAKNQ
jgi:Spy/CpxP family protein refolding chaperone